MTNPLPNSFLMEIAKGRKPGKALDVGMGQGRNSIWLAQQGWDVTGFDPAENAAALARENARKLGIRVNTEIKGWQEFDFGDSRWDMIVLSYVPSLFPKLRVVRYEEPVTDADFGKIKVRVVRYCGERP